MCQRKGFVAACSEWTETKAPQIWHAKQEGSSEELMEILWGALIDEGLNDISELLRAFEEVLLASKRGKRFLN